MRPIFIQLRIGGSRAIPREATLLTATPANGIGLAIKMVTTRDAPGEREKQAAILFENRQSARNFARALLLEACDQCDDYGVSKDGLTCQHREP